MCDDAASCDGVEKLEGVVFKDEKVALGMKAFRRIKMHPEAVAADPLLKGHGKAVPRMLLIDPVNVKISVLEKGRLKTSKLYKAMGKVASKVFKEKLDKVVKTHLNLLTEQDQLANAEKVLSGKVARLKDNAKKLKKVKKEQEEVRTKLADIRKKQAELWKLTPKKAKKKAST